MAGFTKHKYAKDLTQTKNSFNTYVKKISRHPSHLQRNH